MTKRKHVSPEALDASLLPSSASYSTGMFVVAGDPFWPCGTKSDGFRFPLLDLFVSCWSISEALRAVMTLVMQRLCFTALYFGSICMVLELPQTIMPGSD